MSSGESDAELERGYGPRWREIVHAIRYGGRMTPEQECDLHPTTPRPTEDES